LFLKSDNVGQSRAMAHSRGRWHHVLFKVKLAFTKAMVLTEFPNGKVAVVPVLYKCLKYFLFNYFLSFEVPSCLLVSYYFNIGIIGGI
jgi:hypothetical protein